MHDLIGDLYFAGALAALYGFFTLIGGTTPKAQLTTLLLLGFAFLADAYSWLVVPVRETSSSLLWKLDSLGVIASFIAAALAANTTWSKAFGALVLALETYLITALVYWFYLPTQDPKLFASVMETWGATSQDDMDLYRLLALLLFSVSPVVLALGYFATKGWLPWVRTRWPHLWTKRWHVLAVLIGAYYVAYNVTPWLLL